jgi:aldehyde dehydrogenase (NAD+)
VRAARSAFDEWSRWTPAARAEALRALADAIDRRADELARRVSEQNGMPIGLSKIADSRRPGQFLRYYAEVACQQTAEETRGSTLVRRLPLGVVAAVVPWNFPNTMAALKYAPALAAGCTVVVKTTPETVLDAIVVAEAALDAGLPPGVLNLVTGGREAGRYLVGHPDVDKVSFTGSTEAGREVGAAAGTLLRPVTLELGGKSAAVVLDDADLDLGTVGARLAPALFGNNGQTCFLTSRVLAPRSRYDEVVDTVVTLARSLTVGDALDPATRIGPLVSERQRAWVEGYIGKGRADGARLVLGGGRPAAQTRGWFVEPTVFADVDNASTIAQEEIFGPVMSVLRFSSEEEAYRITNDVEYGLAAGV